MTARFVVHDPDVERLALVDEGYQREIHSVLLQQSIEFTIYLPPRRGG